MREGGIYIERRRHKRVERNLKVSYRLISMGEIENDINMNMHKTKVESIDISTSGIQFICKEKIDVDSIIRIDIEIPFEKTLIETFAEVRWCKFDSKNNNFRVGLYFLVIKEDHIN